jgi:hypothetical protein
MTCLEVRDRLTEHSLGVLSKPDARDVERHLEWCAGCRKEASQLLEGAASMALSLPAAEPPSTLEGRIVERFRMASGKAPAPARGRLRVLVAATLMAAILALSGFGWALAERGKAASIEQTKLDLVRKTRDLSALSANLLQELKGRGVMLTATLLPPTSDQTGFGTAIIFSGPTEGFVLVDVPVLPTGQGPFKLQLVGEGVIAAGQMGRGSDRLGLLKFGLPGPDLGKMTTVTVIDESTGAVVLTGDIQPYVGA